MLRRSAKSVTTINQKQAELARQESELRNEVAKLEQIIADAPRVAEEALRREREELLQRASEGSSRLDVSMTLQDKRYGDDDRDTGPRVSMRRERREGRIIFLVLVIALTAAVIWLVTNFHL